MAVTQSHYRFGQEIGGETEANHSWYAAEDTSPAQGVIATDTTFFLRFCLQCDATLQSNIDPEFQYRKNGGTWTQIDGASLNVRAVATAIFTNGQNTTKRLSGTGTFETTSAGCTHDGIAGGTAFDIIASGNGETMCSMQLRSADLTTGDVIDFRLTRDGGVLMDTYAVTPSLTVTVSGAAIVSAGTGPWSTGGTWVGGVSPGDGDRAVISSGHVVTVTSTQAVGSDTLSPAIQMIGSLIVNAPLTIKGTIPISQERTATLTVNSVGANTGALIFNPASGVTPHWDTPNTGAGTPSIVLTGEAAERVAVSTSLARSGNRAYFDFSLYPPTLDWDYVDILDVGGTGDTVSTRFMTYVGVGADSITWDFVRMKTYGRMHFTLNTGDFTFDLQNCDFRAPRNTNALQVNNDTAKTSGVRQVKNCTMHHTAIHSFVFWAQDFDWIGGVSSNLRINPDIQDAGFRITGDCFIGNDVTSSGGIISAGIPHSFICEDTMFLSNCDNPHYVSLITNGTNGAEPIVRRVVVDGCGFVGSDAGDFCLPDGPFTMANCLLINRAGSLFSGLSTTQIATIRRCTLNGNGTFINAGESAMAATSLARISSCLFVGMPSGMMYDTLTAQSGLNLDYNWFFNQTNTANFDHPTLPGSPNSYLLGPTSWFTAGAYGDDDKGLHDLTGDPQFADPTDTSISWYNSIAGSGGSYTNIIAKMIEINGTAVDGTSATFSAAYTTTALLSFLRASFKPQNPLLYAAGDPDDGSPSIGAIDVDPPAVPPQITYPRQARFRKLAIGADL